MKSRIVTFLFALTAFSAVAGAQNEHWRQEMEKNQRRGAADDVKVTRAASDEARWALSTNAVNWAWFGTANASMQYSLSSKTTLTVAARYNGLTYKKDQVNQFEARQQTYGAGLRYWQWYTYSGLWFEGRALFSQYNEGGMKLLGSTEYAATGTLTAEEGYRLGASVGVGYSIQIKSWLNIDVGLYGWGGRRWYKTYSCTKCGERIDPNGVEIGFDSAYTKGWFIKPDEAMISLMFIF